MKTERIIQLVIAFLVVAGFLVLILGNLLDVTYKTPEEKKLSPAGGAPEISGKETGEPGAVSPEAEKKKTEPLDPAVAERLDRLNDAEIRVFGNMQKAEEELKLSDTQKEVVRSVMVDTLLEMEEAADSAAKKNDPAAFDEAVKKAEADAKERLKKVLDPVQLEKLKRMAEEGKKDFNR
ncbi:MAG: hypothetical protein ACYS8W_09410 [Planctomycetota bacterium]|jgi:hypothetical protein